MSIFGGNDYNFYFTHATENRTDREYAIRRFIDNANKNAIAVIREDGEFTHDMIFVEPKHLGGEDIEMTCIYARHNKDAIGKQFVAPYENLISYRNAMQEREFFELGDMAVGLPSSSCYHVTSVDALFVGKIMPEEDYENPSVVATRRWGDIYCTMGVIHSTEGDPGESHRVEMHHFIPTHDPSSNFEEAKGLYSHVGISESVEGLVQGIVYPVDDLSMSGTQNLELYITGIEKPIPFDFGGMRLFKKGEFL